MKKHIAPWKPKHGERFELASVGNTHVKIYRRERPAGKDKTRFIYEVADFTKGSRKMQGFGDLGKARSEAERVARQVASGQALAAEMDSRQAASYGRGVELLRPTGLSLEAACATVARGIEILGSDRIIEACLYFQSHGADTVIAKQTSTVVEELVANREAAKKSERYIKDLRARTRSFAKNFGAVDISSITTADVQGWLDGLKLSPRSTKNFRGALSTLFKFAAARQYIAKANNPVDGTESIKTNGSAEEIEVYTPDELQKLLKASSDTFLPFLILGAFAGLRSAEIERLEWKEIAHDFIKVAADKAKTRSRRLVPVLPNLGKWLANYANRKGRVWTGSERDLLDARAETVKAAGIPWKDNAMRHSFISYRLADTQDVAKVALEAGNSPAMIFKHYRELVKPDAAKTWFSISPEQSASQAAK